MSAGPGRVMRALADAIDATPVLTVSDLCRAAYPTASRVEKKHRVAVIRAMRSLASRRDDLKLEQRWSGDELLLYRKAPEYQRRLMPRSSSKASASWVEIEREWRKLESFTKLFKSASPAARKRFLEEVGDSTDIIPWRD